MQCSAADLLREYPDDATDHGAEVNSQIEIDLKYAGYIKRQQIEVEKLSSLDKYIVPKTFDYDIVVGLRNEAKEKLNHKKPHDLGQASRISGVSPADISILMVALQK